MWRPAPEFQSPRLLLGVVSTVVTNIMRTRYTLPGGAMVVERVEAFMKLDSYRTESV